MCAYSENRIKGTLYGLAIGDAMGATTEFMSQQTIKRSFKRRTDIIGKGWLNLYPGEVTDPTEMAFCICDALEHAIPHRGSRYPDILLNECCKSYVRWYDSHPVDMEECVRNAIIQCGPARFEKWMRYSLNPENIDRGSLFTAIPLVLSGHHKERLIEVGRLTHNSNTCDYAVQKLRQLLRAALGGQMLTDEVFSQVPPHDCHVLATLGCATYHVETTATVEGAIIEAVYHGGDTDAIAALTGALAGAMYGYDAIPERWIHQLHPAVIEKLEHYSAFLLSIQINRSKK